MNKRIESYPGFIDLHVHFRDPGFPEAETTATGLAAAERGGFAAVVTMPNTMPACDSPAMLEYQRQKSAGSSVRLWPSAAITVGRAGRKVAPLEELAEAGAAFFTDDGTYVADDKVMLEAMRRSAKLGLAVCDHALRRSPGVIRDCSMARRLGLPTVAVEDETAAIRRDISLCRETGCRLHIQHISTATGVELIREARREGLPVTAEVTPHHLLLSCDDLSADDSNFKMSPPLGNHEDRAELRRAAKEGVLLFATDHAPHVALKKSGGFRTAANGIIGIESAVSITHQVMVGECGMSETAWAAGWWKLPREVLPDRLRKDAARLPPTVLETGEAFAWNLSESLSLSRNCPYDGFISFCHVAAKSGMRDGCPIL